jgi:hypothetical protein
MNNIQVQKRDNKIVLWGDDFGAISEFAKLLSLKDTIIRVNGSAYKVKNIKDKTATLQIEGEFEEFKPSQSARSQNGRYEK